MSWKKKKMLRKKQWNPNEGSILNEEKVHLIQIMEQNPKVLFLYVNKEKKSEIAPFKVEEN